MIHKKIAKPPITKIKSKDQYANYFTNHFVLYFHLLFEKKKLFGYLKFINPDPNI